MATTNRADPADFRRHLGARLRQARLEVGWSQRALAQAAGLTADAISNYERGCRLVNLDTLVVLAQALHRPISYFVEDESVAAGIPSGSRLAHVVAHAQQHPGEVDFLCDLFEAIQEVRARRGRRLGL